jgi:hypothetical protein
MKTIELWYGAPNDEELEQVLESMTLEERKDMESKMHGIIANRRFDCMSDRLLAKDFFVKGYLAFSTRHLTDEEKAKFMEELRNETISSR